MIQTAEQVFETIKILPADEREKLDRLMAAGRSNGCTTAAIVYRNERFEKAQKWIHENKKKYDGQFVLLEGDEMLGHGMDAKILYEKARSLGIKSPYVARIKAFEGPYFGGW